MGIRINKAMGYGFTDFKGAQDPRLSGPHVLEYDWYVDAFEEFCQWVLDNRDEAVKRISEYERVSDLGLSALFRLDLEEPIEKHDFRPEIDPLVYSPEGGDPSAILWIPPAHKEQWYRRNDTLDWHQAFVEHQTEDLNPKVVDLWSKGKRGPYPYEGAILKPGLEDKFLSLVDEPDSEEISRMIEKGMGAGTYNRFIGEYAEDLPALIQDEDLIEHLREDWTCKIPGALLLYFDQMEIFSDFKYAYELRPIYYEWWS